MNERRKGQQYTDKEAAREIFGHANNEKPPLEETPFIRYLLIGVNNEGYWNSSAMAIQIEDCVDCLKVLLGDEYDFLFLFDHSSGHDKKRAGALDMGILKGGFAVKQPKTRMRDTVIPTVGACQNVFNAGDTQCLYFAPDADDKDRPFWMSLEERRARRNDVMELMTT